MGPGKPRAPVPGSPFDVTTLCVVSWQPQAMSAWDCHCHGVPMMTLGLTVQ